MKTMKRKGAFRKTIRLLNLENTLSINRLLAHSIGLQETLMYQALLSKYLYYLDNDLVDENGWFYSTASDLQESTTFTAKTQRRLANNLCDLELIEKRLAGMPRKTYYRIIENDELLDDYLLQGEEINLNLKRKNKNNQENKQTDVLDEKTIASENKCLKNKNQTDVSVKKEENIKNERSKTAEKPSVYHCSAHWEQQAVPDGNNKQCPMGTTSSAHWEQQVVPIGNNKQCPTGTTSSALWEQQAVPDGNNIYKTKENKTKENKLKTKNVISNNRSFDSKVTTPIKEEKSEGMKERADAYQIAREKINYDYCVSVYPMYKEFIDAIVDIIAHVYSCRDKVVYFSGTQRYYTSVFLKRLESFNEESVREIVEKMNNLEDKITNPTAYLVAVIYNEQLQTGVRMLELYRDA